MQFFRASVYAFYLSFPFSVKPLFFRMFSLNHFFICSGASLCFSLGLRIWCRKGLKGIHTPAGFLVLGFLFPFFFLQMMKVDDFFFVTI